MSPSPGYICKVTDIANDTVLIYSYDDQNRVTKMVEYDATSLDLTSSVWQAYDEYSRISSVDYDVAYGSGSRYSFGYSFSYNTNDNIGSVFFAIGGGYYDYGEITYDYDALQRATNKTFTLTLTVVCKL